MSATITAQTGWTTTNDVPLRSDLRWAIKSRLAAGDAQDQARGRLGKIGGAVQGAIAAYIGLAAYRARLERDLADGTCQETLGDVEIRPAPGKDRPGEVRVNGIVLRLARQQEQEAAATLGTRGRLHGATVCYSPNARMLLEIVTADGVLIYRPPELLRR